MRDDGAGKTKAGKLLDNTVVDELVATSNEEFHPACPEAEKPEGAWGERNSVS
mgnify:CR=1 FL=1